LVRHWHFISRNGNVRSKRGPFKCSNETCWFHARNISAHNRFAETLDWHI